MNTLKPTAAVTRLFEHVSAISPDASNHSFYEFTHDITRAEIASAEVLELLDMQLEQNDEDDLLYVLRTLSEDDQIELANMIRNEARKYADQRDAFLNA